MLDGIIPAPRGIPQVEVTFDIDANGILSVSAKDQGTGKEQKIVIQSNSGLSDDEIEQMVEDAKTNEEEDSRRRAEIETKNQADSLIYSTEKLIQDNVDNIPEDIKSEVETKLEALKTASAANDIAGIQTATAELNSSAQKLGEHIYSQQTQESGSEETTTNSEEDDTVEGEAKEI